MGKFLPHVFYARNNNVDKSCQRWHGRAMKCKCCKGSGQARDHKKEGADLRKFREAAGLSLRRTAKLLEISPSMLSKMESGERVIPFGCLRRAVLLFTNE